MANPNWMSLIPNNGLKLAEICMPSAHDAGVSTPSFVVRKACPASWAICQSQNIAGQLNSGARFFDVRFDMKGGVATTTHETAGMGGWGETAQQIMQAIAAFLQANNQEIVILRVTHTNKTAGAGVYQAADRYLRTPQGGALFYVSGTRKNVTQEPLRALRGKAIVCYDTEALPENNPMKGQIRFSKASGTGREGIICCGVYSKTKDMAKVNHNAVQGVNAHRLPQVPNGPARCTARDHFCQIYWQQTVIGGDIRAATLSGANGVALPVNPTALNTAHGTHFNLPFMLKWASGGQQGASTQGGKTEVYPAFPDDNNRYKWAPNIINMDFINDQVCDAIIAYNEQNLRDAGKWIAVA